MYNTARPPVCTVQYDPLSAQYSTVHCAILSTLCEVQYGLLSVFGVISNPTHIPHWAFGRTSNTFYWCSAPGVCFASLPRPLLPKEPLALPTSQAPRRTPTGYGSACKRLWSFWNVAFPRCYPEYYRSWRLGNSSDRGWTCSVRLKRGLLPYVPYSASAFSISTSTYNARAHSAKVLTRRSFL